MDCPRARGDRLDSITEGRRSKSKFTVSLDNQSSFSRTNIPSECSISGVTSPKNAVMTHDSLLNEN